MCEEGVKQRLDCNVASIMLGAAQQRKQRRAAALNAATDGWNWHTKGDRRREEFTVSHTKKHY
jgi:hypothetical protein